jgi:tetratricopeptide (TPR) repeat protein
LESAKTLETPDAAAVLADKKLKRRLASMSVFLLILLVPISLGIYQVAGVYRQNHRNQAWAEAELTKPQPNPLAYGVLGSIYLAKKDYRQALPLLENAAAAESKGKDSSADHINLANAWFLAWQVGLEPAGKENCLKTLVEAVALAKTLPPGAAAGAYYEAGKLYHKLEMKAQAVENLSQAVAIQKTDWVDLGGGKGYKFEGLANLYAKEYLIVAEGR